MPGKLHVWHEGEKHTLLIESEESVLSALRRGGLYIPTPCGGNGTCGKCIVEIYENKCLACQTVLDSGMKEIELRLTDSEKEFDVLDVYKILRPIVCDRNADYGIAVDIGTTTLVFELLNMRDGTRVATYSQENSQRAFGADVITRIDYANNGGREQLHDCIIKDIRHGIGHTINRSGLKSMCITYVAVTGNTTMLHLLMNLPCDTLGVYPFTPVFIVLYL